MAQINSVWLINYKIMALQHQCSSQLNTWQLLQLISGLVSARSSVNSLSLLSSGNTFRFAGMPTIFFLWGCQPAKYTITKH